MGSRQTEGIANKQHESGGVSKLVLASHDDHLLPLLNEAMKPLGIEVLPLAAFHVPEPALFDGDLTRALKTKAAMVSAAAGLPAIGHARSFRIDPLLRHGGDGGPQWRWPVPWPGAKQELAAQLIQADNALTRGGYCGPDDRGAFFHTLLCLAWPDARTRVFEGRMEGQFAQLWHGRKKTGDLMPGFADCFLADGETASLADLDDGSGQWNKDEKQAIDALRHALASSGDSVLI